MLVTSGTVDVVGPLDTLSVIVLAGGWYVPASGLCAMTVSFGWSDSTSLRLTANPRPSNAELALSNVDPTTFGTITGFGPLETLSVTVWPCSTDAPAVGRCEITSSCGALASTLTIFGFRFARRRSS